MGEENILITGFGEKSADSLVNFVGKYYKAIRCAAIATDLGWSLRTEHPQAIIICLQQETEEMLKVYKVLEDAMEERSVPVMIIGDGEDNFQFQRRIQLNDLRIFERPLDRERLLATLRELFDQGASHGKTMNGRQDTRYQEEIMDMEKRAMAKAVDNKKSVLVVDDDVRMLNVIKMYLEELYEVTVVPNGKLALKFVSKKPVDLILLDYLMPEMDGPEVLKQIRENSPYPDVPVIFLTGVSDKNEVMRGLELKPSGYLLKPVKKETLLERVTEAILGI